MQPDKRRPSSFSILLLTAAVSIIGITSLPGLHIQHDTEESTGSIQVSFSYPEASPRVVESDVTAILEGAFNTLGGVSGIKSVSRQGGGSVTVSYHAGTDAAMARFELSSRIRAIREKLPESMSYPSINCSFTGEKERAILSFLLYADISEETLADEAVQRFTAPLAAIDGVESVRISQPEAYDLTLVFQPDRLQAAGLSPDGLADVVRSAFASDLPGRMKRNDTLTDVRFTAVSGPVKPEELTVRMGNGSTCRLGDLCDIIPSLPEVTPCERVNGLQAVTIQVFAANGVNTIAVGRRARSTIEAIRRTLPPGMSLYKTADDAELLEREIHSILLQGLVSLLVLTLFLFFTCRDIRYLSIILISVIVTLLISILTCRTAGITFSRDSLAGITISLGIIMDTAIVVTDHLAFRRQMHIGGAVTGALLTTIGALVVLKMYPDSGFGRSGHFISLIIISLSVAFVVALAIIPSLLDVMPVKSHLAMWQSMRSRRRIVTAAACYGRCIGWCRLHRKWLTAAMVLAFGIPLHLLPANVTTHGAEQDGLAGRLKHAGCRLYNGSIGSSWYQIHRRTFENALGGACHYSATHVRTGQEEQTEEGHRTLVLEAFLPDESDIRKTDRIIREMEQFLKTIGHISMFRTSLYSATSAQIQIEFVETADEGALRACKQSIWTHAHHSGGASWTLYGIDSQILSNKIRQTRVPYGIYLTGYNHDMLCRYGKQLEDMLNGNIRVVDAAVMEAPDRWARQELVVEYDREALAEHHMNATDIRRGASRQTYRQRIGPFHHDGKRISLQFVSGERDHFNRWLLEHDDAAGSPAVHLAHISRQYSGNDIVRTNQAYELFIGYQFIGPDDWAEQITSDCVRRMNEEILPMGYRAESMRKRNASHRHAGRTGLILFVSLVIFLTGSVLFESFSDAGALLVLIPTGLTGLFLAFGLTRTAITQGGLAAMVMLCGLVVNTGIYLLHEFRTGTQKELAPVRRYLRAFNRKIVPSMLTVISTVLGLVPFLFNKEGNPFWFAFAAGVSGGMLLSVAGIVICLPAFLRFPPKASRTSVQFPADEQNGAGGALADGENERMIGVEIDDFRRAD